ncbi:BglG family transcription antiterminator [Kalamiella sp. sgz302252]|uniref:BglG family transcription antiterminator n=1 Tax=Pantoea sp. sgz302252 TaxID=3341827 RepID=UPI0036D359DC
MSYHPRIRKLIALLHQAGSPLTGREIAKKLAIKVRTLRSDIARYREDLAQDGVQLLSRQGVGYELIVSDGDKYAALLDAFRQPGSDRHAVLPRTLTERVNYLIRALLAASDYLRLDDLADEMCVSRSTLNSCMKEVRESLARFGLQLSGKSACGVKLSGSELGLRQAIARYFFYDDNLPADADALQLARRREIRAMLAETLEENQLKLTDTGLQSMVVHLEIALLRLTVSSGKPSLPTDYAGLQDSNEYLAARQLAARLEAAFGVRFPETERCIIAIHLSGKRSLSPQCLDEARSDISQLIDKIIRRLVSVYNVNFADDFELYKLLSLHLMPMLERLRWQLKIQNPLLQQIKEENLQAFDMAVLAADTIRQETGLSMDEAETGYLAVHFALALERQERQHKSSVVVVCASGTGSSQLLLYRIKQRFAQSLSRISVVQLYELKQFDLRGYDAILSTVEVPFATEVPLLRINAFPELQELTRVEQWLQAARPAAYGIPEAYFRRELFFTDLQSRERDALISEFCQRIARHVAVGENFTQRVLAREHLSSTEFGNGVAIPHPLQPGGEQTFVAVAILPAAILWHTKKVRYLFLLNICEGEKAPLDPLYDCLISLLESPDRLAQLTDATFSAFLSLLRSEDKKPQAGEIRL